MKFINLAQQIYDHPDFQQKYLTTKDEQHRNLEFEKLVKILSLRTEKRN